MITLMMRVGTVLMMLAIIFALTKINATLGRIADRLPVAVEVRSE